MLGNQKKIRWEDLKNLRKIIEREREKTEKVLDAFNPLFETADDIIEEEFLKNEKGERGIDSRAYSVSFYGTGPVTIRVKKDFYHNPTLEARRREIEAGNGDFCYDNYSKDDYEYIRCINIEFGRISEVINPKVADYNAGTCYFDDEDVEKESRDPFYLRFKVSTFAKISFIEDVGFFGFLNDNTRRFPLTFKRLFHMFSGYEKGNLLYDIQEALLQDIANFSYGGKDMLNEYHTNPFLLVASPYTVNDYLFADSKLDFVSNKEGLVSENDVKRFPALFTSYLREAKKVLMPRDFPKFRKYLQDTLTIKNYDYVQMKEFAEMITNYYTDVMSSENNVYPYWTVLDYVKMMMDLKKPISLSLSYKSLINKHDSVAIEHRKYIVEKKRKSKDDELKMPKKYNAVKVDGFKKLDRVSEFTEEADLQHNCVVSYIPNVEKGECVILSGEIEDTHYTVEIRLADDNQFRIYQMMKANNVPASDEHLEELFRRMETFNKRRKVREVPGTSAQGDMINRRIRQKERLNGNTELEADDFFDDFLLY